MKDKEKVLDDTQEEVVALEEEELLEEEKTLEESEANGEDENLDLDEINLDEEEDEKTMEEIEPEPDKPKQTPEENAKWAAKRREAETKANKATDDLKNILKPYNVSSYEDLNKILEIEIDKNTRRRLEAEALERGRDEEDYIDQYVMKEELKLMKAKEKARVANEEAKKAIDDKVQNEMTEFKRIYKGIDPDKVLRDEHFLDYAEGKLGKYPLAEVYEKYKKHSGVDLEKAKQKAERSTGSATVGKRVSLTLAQSKIVDAWNKANPHNKMTPEEFLRR